MDLTLQSFGYELGHWFKKSPCVRVTEHGRGAPFECTVISMFPCDDSRFLKIEVRSLASGAIVRYVGEIVWVPPYSDKITLHAVTILVREQSRVTLVAEQKPN